MDDKNIVFGLCVLILYGFLRTRINRYYIYSKHREKIQLSTVFLFLQMSNNFGALLK